MDRESKSSEHVRLSEEADRGFYREWSGRLPDPSWLPSTPLPLEGLGQDFDASWDAWVDSQSEWRRVESELEEAIPQRSLVEKRSKIPEVAAVVEEWSRLSNGQVDTAELVFERPVMPEKLAFPMLVSLDLECLSGPLAGTSYRFEPVEPRLGFFLLLAHAASANAYGPGSTLATSRLKAWISTAALVGLDAESASVVEIEERAAQCHWCWFESDGPWWGQDWGGLGFFVLRPDRTSAAMLAALDSG